MDAISLHQPWASLIACGAKPYETRDWAPPARLIGERIAICAAKHIDSGTAEFAEELMTLGSGHFDLVAKLSDTNLICPRELLGAFGAAVLPIGCVVCTAVIDGAFLLGDPAKGTAVPAAQVAKRFISRKMPECFTVRYDDYGDYSPGRWAWLLRDVEICKPPIAVKGRQKFFTLPADVVTAVARSYTT